MPDPVVDPAAPPVVDPAAPPAAPQPDAWFAGFDSEEIGHIQSRGWHNKTAAEAAREAVKAHREAAKHIGQPPEKLARIPDNESDVDAWKAFYGKIGAPGDPAKYDFSAIKLEDGTEVPAELLDFVRTTADGQAMPQRMAAGFADALVKFLHGRAVKTNAESQAATAEAEAKLKTDWGANYDANSFIATQAALKLGLDPATIEKFNGVDKAAFQELLRKVGRGMGEDKFVNNGSGLGAGSMTKDEARARLTSLEQDGAWSKRILDGDTEAVKERRALMTIIHGAAAA